MIVLSSFARPKPVNFFETMNSISSVEVNYLVFRYLVESGFLHSAFNFSHEANITNCPIEGDSVRHGALILFIEKGLQYLEMEANNNSGSDEDQEFTFLRPLDLITKDIDELRKLIRGKKESPRKDEAVVKEHEEERGRTEEIETRERGGGTPKARGRPRGRPRGLGTAGVWTGKVAGEGTKMLRGKRSMLRRYFYH